MNSLNVTEARAAQTEAEFMSVWAPDRVLSGTKTIPNGMVSLQLDPACKKKQRSILMIVATTEASHFYMCRNYHISEPVWLVVHMSETVECVGTFNECLNKLLDVVA